MTSLPGESKAASETGPGNLQRSDPRLLAYLIAGFGALLATVVTGNATWAALGAPFAVLAALGLARGEPDTLRGTVSVRTTRVVEGEGVEGEVHVEWDGRAEVDIMLTGWRGVEPVEPFPVPGWSLPAITGPARLPFRVRAESWGVHGLGTLWIRARRPGGLIVRERRVGVNPLLRVLPTPLRLDRLLKPAEPRAVAGVHLSRFRGPGTDLADLRPYRPGDRLRDLSWGTSARLGEPWVRVHHPERTGVVLLLLDSFLANEGESLEALARAARAAWAVTGAHLSVQDRVGLLAGGRTAAWVPPQGGRRARWLLLDELLAVGGAAQEGVRRRRGPQRVVVPADALVVGVTSLRSRTFVQTLLHHRRTGHTTACLVVDTSDLLPPPASPVEAAALRVWAAQRDAERRTLDLNGVPTALVTPTHGVGSAVSALRRRLKALDRTGRERAIR